MVGIDPNTLSTVAKNLQDAKNGKAREKQSPQTVKSGGEGEVRQATDSVDVPPALDIVPSTIGDGEQATAVVRALMEGLKNSPGTASSMHGGKPPSERLLSLLDD